MTNPHYSIPIIRVTKLDMHLVRSCTSHNKRAWLAAVFILNQPFNFIPK